MLILQGGIRQDAEAKGLLSEGREITAILSTSHKTAKENRRRKKEAKKRKKSKQLSNLPIDQLTKSTVGPP